MTHRRLRVEPEAEAELREAAAWYEAQREGLGGAFMSEIEAVLARVRRRPEMFPVHPALSSARRARAKRFPYVVVFLLREGDVFVLAFPHERHDPRALAVTLHARGGT